MKDGKPAGEYEDFLVGFVDDDKNILAPAGWRHGDA